MRLLIVLLVVECGLPAPAFLVDCCFEFDVAFVADVLFEVLHVVFGCGPGGFSCFAARCFFAETECEDLDFLCEACDFGVGGL